VTAAHFFFALLRTSLVPSLPSAACKKSSRCRTLLGFSFCYLSCLSEGRRCTDPDLQTTSAFSTVLASAFLSSHVALAVRRSHLPFSLRSAAFFQTSFVFVSYPKSLLRAE
jgi:hypothetical protein